MKLSKLVYLCVKGATDYGDPSFTYHSFIKGEAEQDQDYGGAIDRVFLPMNAFFQRLHSLGKIPAKTAVCDCSRTSVCEVSGIGTLVSAFQSLIRKDMSVSAFDGGPYRTIDARLSNGKVVLLGRYDKAQPVFVQYRARVAHLSQDDIAKVIESEDANGLPTFSVGGSTYSNEATAMAKCDALQLDLEEAYGITDEICYLCIDWCKAYLEDDKTLGRAEMIDCESRIKDLNKGETLFFQNAVERSFQ